MKVLLKRQWFGPGGSGSCKGVRYRRGEHNFPDAWENILPKDAVVQQRDKAPEVDVPEPADPSEDPTAAFKRQLAAEGSLGAVASDSAAHAAHNAAARKGKAK